MDDMARCMFLMTLWRCWFIRNEVVHNKPAPPVEVSCRFLQSYLDSLIGVKLNSNFDPAKGKQSISYVPPIPRAPTKVCSCPGYRPSLVG